MKKFYTTAELAAMLGCSKETVKSAVDRGDINATKTPGGHARIAEAEARRVVEQGGGVWDTRGLDDMVADFEEKARVIVKETLDLYSLSVLESLDRGLKGKEDGQVNKDVEELINDAVAKLKENAVSIFGG